MFHGISRITKKRLLLALATVAAIAIGWYVFARAYQPAAPLPQEFVTARQSTETVSQSIVGLTQDIGAKMKEIQAASAAKDRTGALAGVAAARTLNEQAHGKAVELANDLESLASSLSQIPSIRSQEIASQAVSLELTLVSEFIDYTDQLNSFFDHLSNAVQSGTAAEQQAATDALAAANQKADAINSQNTSFVQKMQEFDQSL